MNVRFSALLTLCWVLVGPMLLTGCDASSSDFQTFMRIPLPSHVRVIKMDGNWGHDPWRCWQISPVDDDLAKTLISTWKLAPDPHAFHGVASGDHVYCKYDDLTESYSGDADSYRAVGIDRKRKVMLVYFYNG